MVAHVVFEKLFFFGVVEEFSQEGEDFSNSSAFVVFYCKFGLGIFVLSEFLNYVFQDPCQLFYFLIFFMRKVPKNSIIGPLSSFRVGSAIFLTCS